MILKNKNIFPEKMSFKKPALEVDKVREDMAGSFKANGIYLKVQYLSKI